MSDIASLIIRVTTNGVDRASADLGKLGKAALAAGAAIGGLETARRVFDRLIESQRNFDKLNSGLITMTGSAENAAKAFQVLQQFAKETPYGLNQAVEGFTKLVALGLDPSKEALISYGNTAAAMGKDLNQMIEAVADAATGEFERLKEFGIKASQQGDTVSFTFRGVTTTVKKSSEEIQKYLLNIGNTDFAGAMETRSKTLDGALSSLEDTVEGFFITVARSGFGDFIAEQAAKAEDAIQTLTDGVASGEFITEVKAYAEQVDVSFKFVSDLLNQLVGDFADAGKEMSPFGTNVADDIGDGFATLPAMVAATIQEAIAEISAFVDKAEAFGRAIKGALNPLDFKGWAGQLDKDLKTANENLVLEKELIESNRDLTINSYKARIQKSQEMRKAYEEERKKQIDLRSLVKTTPGGGSNGPSAAELKAAKAAERLAEQQRRQAEQFIDTVKRQNRDELAAIDEQERQKLAKLDQFQQEGALKAGEYEATKTQIMLDAEDARQEELKKRKDARDKEEFQADSYLEQLRAQNEGELAEIDRQNDEKLRKLEEFHQKGLVSEDEYQQGLKDIAEATDKAKLDSYTGTLGDVTNALRNSLGEGNALYKAAAITQTIIETYKGATAAYASLATIPIVGPGLGIAAAAAITASGLANVARIRSAREQGGNLSAGQISTIAERGQPEVIMPAGASRVRTAQQMRQIMGENGGKGGGDSVMIINQTSGRIDSAQTERDDEGRLRVIIRELVSGDLQDSNSDISKSRKLTRGQPGH